MEANGLVRHGCWDSPPPTPTPPNPPSLSPSAPSPFHMCSPPRILSAPPPSPLHLPHPFCPPSMSLSHSLLPHVLTTQATQTLVCSLVHSRLAYCKSLLSGCPLSTYQTNFQNAAERLLCKAKNSNIHSILETLHWLQVTYRIQYKISAISGASPEYYVRSPSNVHSSETITIHIRHPNLCHRWCRQEHSWSNIVFLRWANCLE